ncbi:efflux RND transporter periplasmic adaptor subunit [Luteimonas terrae]|uniref:Cobalt-zinc-cadmium efflux system membrane fusion protein n=1 Tax=Luteimonas terrae TaxID=1530191 RepID=A0ABU1XY58_9GAMM|nr:efflux RND transporter periplasmic adaptor subunit [Luteimonas terrae]MDR7193707.1 cobalt-zinc-cadmium efflux system membrane fusion protein [Luteimonas terrae]
MRTFTTTASSIALALLLSACSAPSTAPVADATGTSADEHADDTHADEGDADDDHPDDATTIAADIANDVGIRVAPAAAGTIADQHEVQGLLTTLESGNARVTARFPGPIRRLHAEVGDRVRAGQVLATIDSNLSLSSYTVTAPIAGTVLARNASVGQSAGEGAVLYEIADLSMLWVDLHVFGRDAEHLAAGSPVTISRLGDGATADTRVDRVLPGTATASQSTIARATLDNADGQWRPGSAVRAMVTVSTQAADLVVPLTALQQMDGRDVVFVREGDRYEKRVVTLGRRDARQVEIVDGVAVGEDVVIEQSYTIKADLEKAGAGHAH